MLAEIFVDNRCTRLLAMTWYVEREIRHIVLDTKRRLVNTVRGFLESTYPVGNVKRLSRCIRSRHHRGV